MAKVDKKEEPPVEEAQEETKEVNENLPVKQGGEIELFEVESEDVGLGQNFTADDFAIPRIGMIQSLSPQRDKMKPDYMEACEEGQIFLSNPPQLLDGEKGLIIVPIDYKFSYLEWAPRKSGKGLVKDHEGDKTAWKACEDPEQPGRIGEKGEHLTEDGNEIIPTAQYVVMIYDPVDGTLQPAVMSFAKTSLRQAKGWNVLIDKPRCKNKATEKIEPAPIFFMPYTFKTVPTSNADGTWFRWEIGYLKEEGSDRGTPLLALPNGAGLYDQCKTFFKSVTAGDVKVSAEERDMGAAKETDDDPM